MRVMLDPSRKGSWTGWNAKSCASSILTSPQGGEDTALPLVRLPRTVLGLGSHGADCRRERRQGCQKVSIFLATVL